MNSNSEVVSDQTGGILNVIFKLLKSPFHLVKLFVECFAPSLFNKNVVNCLPGQVVLITGASSGLGEALAHTFYHAGCKVILVARRQEELERVRKDLMQLQTTHKTHTPAVHVIDVSDLNTIPEKVKEILDTHGHIDILVNNAGMSLRSEIVNTDMKVDIQLMLVNYFGSVALTKAVLPSMISRRQGKILFIGSVQSKFGLPERSSYSASKHALQAFTESLRAEVHRHNIQVTIVCPGYVKTNFSMNAVSGNGENYGKMDEATANGVDPFELSRDILRSLLKGDKDVMMCPFYVKAAYKIHYYSPSLFNWIMVKRAEKLAKQEKKQE